MRKCGDYREYESMDLTKEITGQIISLFNEHTLTATLALPVRFRGVRPSGMMFINTVDNTWIKGQSI